MPSVIIMRLHYDSPEEQDSTLTENTVPSVKTPFTTTQMTLTAASEKLRKIDSTSSGPRAPFSFPTSLQMDRYFEENSAKTMTSINRIKELRAAGADLQKQLRTMETRNVSHITSIRGYFDI